ncbi:MAG: RlpA-like double-psi beta-barrel domain-containing protein [Janthinobacterium lividum]
MRIRLAGCVVLALLAVGCTRRAAPPAGPARYLVGGGYQQSGTWFYPREDFHYDATGLAAVLPDRRSVTANGEAFDPTALTAAHQTLQLPSVARVTNLETGAQLLLRINDRGPASPARIIALSPRAASLLGVSGTARVRVQVEEQPSMALREQLGGGPRLTVAAAPRASVTAEALAPPSGVAQSSRGRNAGGPQAAMAEPTQTAETVPDRLPETVTRGPVAPGSLMIRAGSFGQMQYAARVEARLSRIGGRVVRVRDGRSDRFEVQAGPFASVAAADAALDQALRAGVSDARISVE